MLSFIFYFWDLSFSFYLAMKSFALVISEAENWSLLSILSFLAFYSARVSSKSAFSLFKVSTSYCSWSPYCYLSWSSLSRACYLSIYSVIDFSWENLVVSRLSLACLKSWSSPLDISRSCCRLSIFYLNSLQTSSSSLLAYYSSAPCLASFSSF